MVEEKKLENYFNDRMPKEFGFTQEQLKRLERYTDENIESAIAFMGSKSIDEIRLTGFLIFLNSCLCSPGGLREDYIHPEVYWKVEVFYKPYNQGNVEIYRFAFRADLDVFLDKIRSREHFIELNSKDILFPSSISKISFGVTEEKSAFQNYSDFIVKVVEK